MAEDESNVSKNTTERLHETTEAELVEVKKEEKKRDGDQH